LLIIYTDGACSRNPGPGGWGAIVIKEDKFFELGGKSKQTTNNIMEMTSAIEALKRVLDEDGEITLYTDSKYLRDGITNWICNWKINGWRTKSGKDVKNQELWQELDSLNNELRLWLKKLKT